VSQLGLSFDPPVPEPVRPKTLQERFEQFHREHPEVYRELVRLAREWKSAGHDRIGMKALWERCRWELNVGDPDAEYRLNNDYTSRYARLIQEQEPDIAGMFQTRRLKA